ncbi:hypothetical protein [Luteitalea sp.]|uniref:hypothetical protein n=1 Tax=Luteitalea sp. TaxID=2004800 RepID=UPI0025C6C472|nr:hypothetical protein [Luteitalea sp.]
MTIDRDALLRDITQALMRSPRDGQIDVLRLAIAAIAQCVVNYPDWIPSLPPEDQHLVLKVLEVGTLLGQGTEGAVVH